MSYVLESISRDIFMRRIERGLCVCCGESSVEGGLCGECLENGQFKLELELLEAE